MKKSKLISIIGLSFFGGMLANEYFNSKEFDDLSNNIKSKVRDNATKIKAHSEDIKDMMHGLQVIGKLNRPTTNTEENTFITTDINKEDSILSSMMGLVNFMCDMVKKYDDNHEKDDVKEENTSHEDSNHYDSNKKYSKYIDSVNKHIEESHQKRLLNKINLNKSRDSII